MKAELVVVGGGLGGLATAVLAARAGLKVTILERSSQLGGRATTQELGGGLFNQGPHALYRGGPAFRLLRKLKVPFSGKAPSITGLWVSRGGELLPLTAGPSSLLGSPVLDWREKVELGRYFAAVQSVDTNALQSVTLDDWLGSVVSSPNTLQVAQALTRVSTYTNARSVMSAGAAITQMRAAFRHNVMYLDGGWQTLLSGLQGAAERAGVRIITEARVQRVAGGRVVLESGRELSSSSVVLAVSPQVAASLLGDDAGPETTPAHAACLDLALRRLPDPKKVLALGIDEPTYFSVHSRYARLGPVEVIHVAKYLAPGDAGLDARPMLEALADLMQPGWRDELVDARFMPRMTVIQDIPRADRGGFTGRATVVVPGMPGVFRVGDSVGTRGLLADAVFASAEQAAREVIAFHPQPKQNVRRRGLMVA